jgi:dihydrodipicolinate synthase/N-acetylneuraminate lyase
MPERFHGVLPALITPFIDDGSAIDGDALAANVERLIGAGSVAWCRAAVQANSSP